MRDVITQVSNYNCHMTFQYKSSQNYAVNNQGLVS